MTCQLGATVFFFLLFPRRRQRKSWSRWFSRRLITLIFAGRNRIIVIRRELPRTSSAGLVQDLPHRSIEDSPSCAARPLPTPPPVILLTSSKLFFRPLVARILSAALPPVRQ